MGGSQSTRRVIVEDTNGEGVVKISEAVVRRVQGLPEPPKGSFVPEPATFEPTPKKSPELKSRDEEYYRTITQEVEDFYTEKLKDLHERNRALQEQTNDQFTKAVEEVEEKFLNYTSSPICQDLQHKVLQCYQANPSETLNCSPIVNAFTTCVERARVSASINRPQTSPQVTAAS